MKIKEFRIYITVLFMFSNSHLVICQHIVDQPIKIIRGSDGQASFIVNNHDPWIWSTTNTTTRPYPFTDTDLGNLVIQPRTSALRDILFITGDGDDIRMSIKGNGNIGIGNTNPLQKLHMSGNFMLDGNLMRDETNKFIYVAEQTNGLDFESVSQIKVGPYLTLGNFGEGNRSWIGNNAILNYSAYGPDTPSGAGNRFIPAHAPGKALVMQMDFMSAQLQGKTYVWNGNTSEVDLNSFTDSWILGPDFNYFASKVSIGDTYKSGSHMLYVKGSILAEEVQVKLRAQWPDFVFEEGYSLLNLTETEEFIKENKHLPGVPSAAEVAEEGIKLAEMNAILLQKIEELTLHIIKQQKQLEAQQYRIEQLEKK